MPECDYCGASFESEGAELKHLKSEHREELGPIDRRRVGDVDEDDDGIPVGPIALGFVVMASLGIVVYVVFFAGSGGGAGGEPYGYNEIHEHGTITATIEGEEIDFSQPEYMTDDPAFHFHDGYYDQFGEHVTHIHARGVTVQYALETLGIEVDDEGTELTFEGETYQDDESGTEIRIEVNGEPVEPGEHVLRGVGPEEQAAEGEGDDLVVVVETS